MVIKLRKGESVLGKLTAYLEKNRVNSGFFYGIGGVIGPTIAFYDLEKKKFLKKKLPGKYEVLNLTGNVSQGDDGIVIHMHATLSDKAFRVIGGHFLDAKVAGVLELKLSQTEMLERAYDSDTGLNLLK